MRIAVAGGTGTVGRHVVAAARARGHEVVALSRSTGVDVSTGDGLAGALAGIDTVVDVTNVNTLGAGASRRFFETATRHLLAAEENAGVRHHVALSIVGIDDVPAAYYVGKLAQEQEVASGAVPFTVARVAQFHEFAGQLLARMRGPVVVMPRALVRPVAASEVGEHLVRVAEAGPTGRAPDLVGPRDERLADLARRQLAHDGLRRRVLEVPVPGAYGRGLASGALRGTEPFVQGQVTFDEWLDGADDARAA